MQYSEARDALNREDVDANGLGFVLNGDGVVCVDIDDCVEGGEPTVEAREFLDAIGRTYVEYSPSGRGLHVWGFAFMDKGRVFKGRHLKVEVYPNKRFITVTGRPYRDGELGRLDLDAALPLVA
jgi:primase-polymerase (primpol)-like protein